MIANVLNSPVAVQVSIQIVRAFIRLRELLASHRDLARRLDQLERRNDAEAKLVFDAIRQLKTPPEPAEGQDRLHHQGKSGEIRKAIRESASVKASWRW